jgi:hypothetical protein
LAHRDYEDRGSPGFRYHGTLSIDLRIAVFERERIPPSSRRSNRKIFLRSAAAAAIRPQRHVANANCTSIVAIATPFNAADCCVRRFPCNERLML